MADRHRPNTIPRYASNMIRTVYIIAQLIIPTNEGDEQVAGPAYIARTPEAARSWAKRVREPGQTVRLVSFMFVGQSAEQIAVALAAMFPSSVWVPISEASSDAGPVSVDELGQEVIDDDSAA